MNPSTRLGIVDPNRMSGIIEPLHIVHTSPTKDSAAFCRFLAYLKAKVQDKPLHLVLDNGPIHKSRLSQAALADAADWLTIEWLPAYAPELNAIERDWRDMKCHSLAHQTFTDIDSLDWHIHASTIAINKKRLYKPCA